MKLKLTDRQRISRFKCKTKGCLNKASAILEKKFLCDECNPKSKDKRAYYCINYVKGV